MRTLIALTTLLIFVADTQAQRKKRPVTLGGHMVYGAPRGEFNQAFAEDILGFNGNLAIPMRKLPFDVGAQFTWGRMGSEKQTIIIDEDFTDATEGKVNAKTNVYGYHGFLRFKPFTGKIAPYVDGLVGWRAFSTRTKLNVSGVEGPLTNDVMHNDVSMGYGWAAGLMVQLNKLVYVEGRFESLQGGETTYVDPTTLSIDDLGGISYDTKTSNTDVMNVMLGIGFKF